VLAEWLRGGIIYCELRCAKSHFGRGVRLALCLGLTGLVCLQLGMVASESLHKFFHADADEPGHECSVTMFAHGQVDASPVAVPLVVPVAGVEVSSPVVVSVFCAVFKDLPPGRAPPARFVVS